MGRAGTGRWARRGREEGRGGAKWGSGRLEAVGDCVTLARSESGAARSKVSWQAEVMIGIGAGTAID